MGGVGLDAVLVVEPGDGSEVSMVLVDVPTGGVRTVVGGMPGTTVEGTSPDCDTVTVGGASPVTVGGAEPEGSTGGR
jgi:hypothetical protein